MKLDVLCIYNPETMKTEDYEICSGKNHIESPKIVGKFIAPRSGNYQLGFK